MLESSHKVDYWDQPECPMIWAYSFNTSRFLVAMGIKH
jgi:hypothetical protein